MFRTSWLKFILRYIVLAILAVPFGLPFILVPWSANIVIVLFFKTLIPMLGMGYVFFAHSYYFFNRLNLLNPKPDN